MQFKVLIKPMHDDGVNVFIRTVILIAIICLLLPTQTTEASTFIRPVSTHPGKFHTQLRDVFLFIYYFSLASFFCCCCIIIVHIRVDIVRCWTTNESRQAEGSWDYY